MATMFKLSTLIGGSRLEILYTLNLKGLDSEVSC